MRLVSLFSTLSLQNMFNQETQALNFSFTSRDNYPCLISPGKIDATKGRVSPHIMNLVLLQTLHLFLSVKNLLKIYIHEGGNR